MNNDITLFCTVCEAETLHRWFEAEPELGTFEPIWVCDGCENQIYLDEVDCG